MDSLRFEQVNRDAHEGVVLAVLATGEEVVNERTGCLEVGRLSENEEGLEQEVLEHLARHGGVFDAVTSHVTASLAELGHATPAKIGADLGQAGIGVIRHSQAVDLATLRSQCLGNQDRIASPAGE